MKNLLIILLLTAYANTSFAEDKSDIDIDTKELATSLANCGGVFSAMGDVLKSIGKENAAITYEDTARGAYLSGAYTSYMAQDIKDWHSAIEWSENLKETRKRYWLGIVELYKPTEEKPLPDEFMQELDFCTSLSPIQTELVNMMRDKVYK